MREHEDDILARIIEKRRADIARKGVAFGFTLPKTRERKPAPFLDTPGAIMEVKRASPSKGDIAPAMHAAQQALRYSRAGAKAVSVLTEENFFKGNLDDLMQISRAFAKENAPTAILRKDFLLSPEEIEVSYYAGADAVLLIAGILSEAVLIQCAEACGQFGITPFVEIRSESDAQKFSRMKRAFPAAVAGINARDLTDFSIDPLVPLALKKEIDAPVVFESGILSAQSAGFAAAAGFRGILVGEAVSRDIEKAEKIARAFGESHATLSEEKKQNRNAAFWRMLAEKIRTAEKQNAKPLVKVCGITNKDDAVFSVQAGADLLGFVFCAASPRTTDATTVREIRKSLGAAVPFVGVIIDTESPEAREAIALAEEGVLDALQFHGTEPPPLVSFADSARKPGMPEPERVAFFPAQRISSDCDIGRIQDFAAEGYPRILIDAYDKAAHGGTGKQIDSELAGRAKKIRPLWLAGGINAENLKSVLELSPELIDVSSGLEKKPGIKDHEKISRFFETLKSARIK